METSEATTQEMPVKNVRDMAMLTHLLGFAGLFVPLGNLIGPLIVWLLKKEEHPFIDRHGREAVNFQISFTLYYILLISGMMGTFFTGNPQLLSLIVLGVLIAILSIAYLVFMIVAAIKANEGKDYRYPLTIAFLG